MLKMKLAIIVLSAATMLSVPTVHDTAIAAKKAPAVIGAPDAGKGQIVFYRTGGLVGAAISCNVRENGALIGGLSGGKYFVVQAQPGKHVYTTKSEAKDTLNMEVESGETYYVRCNIGAGIMAGRPNLSPVDKAAFDEKSDGLKLKTADQLAKEVAKDSKSAAK
jgi:Protein of unknown function (DUF2846)